MGSSIHKKRRCVFSLACGSALLGKSVRQCGGQHAPVVLHHVARRSAPGVLRLPLLVERLEQVQRLLRGVADGVRQERWGGSLRRGTHGWQSRQLPPEGAFLVHSCCTVGTNRLNSAHVQTPGSPEGCSLHSKVGPVMSQAGLTERGADLEVLGVGSPDCAEGWPGHWRGWPPGGRRWASRSPR